MLESVGSTIAGLRRVVGAQNDSEPASKLGIDKSTVSGWRARGRVPERLVKVLATEPTPSAEVWPELHDRGTAVALARYAIMRNEAAMSGNLDTALPAFLDVKPFWLVMRKAVFDLRAKMDALHVDVQTAAALLLRQDLCAPQETAARVARMLAQDHEDSPRLRDWKQDLRPLEHPLLKVGNRNRIVPVLRQSPAGTCASSPDKRLICRDKSVTLDVAVPRAFAANPAKLPRQHQNHPKRPPATY